MFTFRLLFSFQSCCIPFPSVITFEFKGFKDKTFVFFCPVSLILLIHKYSMFKPNIWHQIHSKLKYSYNPTEARGCLNAGKALLRGRLEMRMNINNRRINSLYHPRYSWLLQGDSSHSCESQNSVTIPSPEWESLNPLPISVKFINNSWAFCDITAFLDDLYFPWNSF